MESVISAIRNTVPISLFNKGMAGKIFQEVKQKGPKVVIKNNCAECVLLSPEEYTALIDAVNEAELLTLAVQRLENSNSDKYIPLEKIDEKYGITSEMIEMAEEVEFE